jgi:hypothetical protein
MDGTRDGRLLMPRYQVDDSFYDDPAVSRAGTAAVGLYFRCGVYVARHLLDGHVPSEVAAQYGTPEWIRRLTDAGLWEAEPGGHYMPRYLNEDKNPTRAKVLEEREMKQKRQQRWLEKTRNISSEQRRVSRRVDRPSAGTSGDGPRDAAHPSSLTGRRGARARDAAPASPPPPLAAGVSHAFAAGGPGGTCGSCQMPESNRRHREAS